MSEKSVPVSGSVEVNPEALRSIVKETMKEMLVGLSPSPLLAEGPQCLELCVWMGLRNLNQKARAVHVFSGLCSVS